MAGDIEVVNLDQVEISSAKFNSRMLAASIVGQLPGENILSESELELFKYEKAREVETAPIKVNKLVVVLKATRLCNLRCTYCHSWAEGPGQSLSINTLIKVTKQILSLPNVNRFEFVWHGGEVTMLRTTFFKKLIWLQQQFKRPEQVITNNMQSNATNFSVEWLTFLKGLGMSVGISLDGIPRVNDSRRVDFKGRGTSHKVEAGIQRLREYSIPYGALVVVDKAVRNTDLKEMFAYFKSIDLNSIEFLNIVPDNRANPGEINDDSFITYKEYMEFLVDAFKVWNSGYRDSIRVSLFDEFINKLSTPKYNMTSCYWTGDCSQEVITIEPNGDVSPCDKYVDDLGSIYGSLLEKDLASLLKNSEHNQESLREEITASEKMKTCEWFHICNGGCPHDRIINRKHVSGYSDECCGTGRLIEVIESTIKTGSQSVQAPN